jgi:hypothetical protein
MSVAGREPYLDSDAFVLVANFNVVDMDVRAPNINAIEASHVAPMNNHVVDFAIRARIHRKMESGC